MRTTVNLPDDLLVAAKQRAANEGTTLRAIVERALRADLGANTGSRKRVALRWVTVEGGLPPGMKASHGGAMHNWLRRAR